MVVKDKRLHRSGDVGKPSEDENGLRSKKMGGQQKDRIKAP